MYGIYDELTNDSSAEIKLIEFLLYSPEGSYGSTILLPPHGRRLFPASKFSDRNRLTGRPSIIVVFVDGVKASQSLTPEQFKRFTKLRFSVDGDGKLTIKGVEAKFCDLLQFWGWRCFGGTHVGRPELAIS